MNGTTNSVVMTDCNHATKNLRSQLVLGTTIVSGGNAIFDVGILSLAGVPQELYRVNDYASDVLVLKLCSSATINKLLNLLLNSNEDPMNIGFMAITLYFLRSFICAFNTIDISCEGRVTMMWSALMWFSSLKGIHPLSKNNFITSCLGGIFLATQKKVRNLRLTTTEPIEHAFGTARSWRREFTVNEFLIYCNKIDYIMKNVVEHDIRTSTSQKGYMHGFQGFANVVKEMNSKLSKKNVPNVVDSWAVDVDYNSTVPIIEQISSKVVKAIKRIQGPILNLMRLFGMNDISSYCSSIDSVNDICSIYQSMSRQHSTISNVDNRTSNRNEQNADEMLARLTDIALDFNAGNGNSESADAQLIVPSNIITNLIQKECSIVEELDCEIFFKFISQDISSNNIGHMLHYMSQSMCSSFEKNTTQGSISSLQKVQSLKGRWFKVNANNVEQISNGDSVERNSIYFHKGKYYRVLSIFQKTYNKWRHERMGKKNDKMKVHLQVLELYHGGYHAHDQYKYLCEDSHNLGVYIGHAFNYNK